MFSTNCTTKGCGKFQEPYIDKETKKVYCSVCDQEIVNLNKFTINQLISLKQYKKKSTQSFQFKCKSCNKTDYPVKVKNDYVCKGCKASLNISKSFQMLLDISLKNVNKDIE